MKIAIIGASGFAGTALLNEAVRRDHTITAIARHPVKINLESDQITTKKVDVRDKEKLTKVLRGHVAVLSAFNAGWENPNLT